MTRIVCNSGPLIALGILGRLDILKLLFDEVLVPKAVQREIEQGGTKLSGLEDFRRAHWIRIVPLNENRDELLESLLDVGEAAVLSLARAEKATLVLIDERKARKVARDIYASNPSARRVFWSKPRGKIYCRRSPLNSKSSSRRVIGFTLRLLRRHCVKSGKLEFIFPAAWHDPEVQPNCCSISRLH